MLGWSLLNPSKGKLVAPVSSYMDKYLNLNKINFLTTSVSRSKMFKTAGFSDDLLKKMYTHPAHKFLKPTLISKCPRLASHN